VDKTVAQKDRGRLTCGSQMSAGSYSGADISLSKASGVITPED